MMSSQSDILLKKYISKARSKNYYDSEFTPSKLSVDDNTIAFYDFSNNAEDSSVNALHGSGTNVTYSTDCAF